VNDMAASAAYGLPGLWGWLGWNGQQRGL